jgi:hypothetical protein
MAVVMLVEQVQTGEPVRVAVALVALVEVFHHPSLSKAPQGV